MADKKTPDVAPETTEAKKTITKPQMIGLAVVAGALLWMSFSPNDESSPAPVADSETEEGGPKVKLDIDKAIEAESKSGANDDLSPLKGGMVDGLVLQDVNSQAAVAVLSKRHQSLENTVKELNERLLKSQTEFKSQMEKQQQELQAQVGQIKDIVLQSDYQTAVAPRDGGIPMPTLDGGSPAGGIAFNDNPFPAAGGVTVPAQSREPAVVRDDGRYMVLSGTMRHGQAPTGADGKGGSSMPGLSNPFTEPPTNIKLGGQEVDITTAKQQTIVSGAMSEGDLPEEGGDWLIIPAFSFVDTTLLHAVSCPVGGSLVGSGSSIPPRPIVLPVRGIFKGPNGAAYDIGHVHLFGLCSARYDVKGYGRAEITIQKLSYWLNDSERTPIEVDLTGYIVDSTDNEIDVKGPVKSLERKYLLAETLGQGIAAYANVLKQGEFTNQVSADGNTTSVLTGSAAAAAGTSAVAGMMTTWSDFMKRKAQAVVDTVYVNGGHRVKVVTTQQIKVRLPAPPVDDKVWKSYEKLYL